MVRRRLVDQRTGEQDRARLLEQAAPRTPVLSYAELGGQLTLVTSGVVNVTEVTAA